MVQGSNIMPEGVDIYEVDLTGLAAMTIEKSEVTPESILAAAQQLAPSQTRAFMGFEFNTQTITYAVIGWILTNITNLLFMFMVLSSVWAGKVSWDNHLDRMYNLAVVTSESIKAAVPLPGKLKEMLDIEQYKERLPEFKFGTQETEKPSVFDLIRGRGKKDEEE